MGKHKITIIFILFLTIAFTATSCKNNSTLTSVPPGSQTSPSSDLVSPPLTFDPTDLKMPPDVVEYYDFNGDGKNDKLEMFFHNNVFEYIPDDITDDEYKNSIYLNHREFMRITLDDGVVIEKDFDFEDPYYSRDYNNLCFFNLNNSRPAAVIDFDTGANGGYGSVDVIVFILDNNEIKFIPVPNCDIGIDIKFIDNYAMELYADGINTGITLLVSSENCMDPVSDSSLYDDDGKFIGEQYFYIDPICDVKLSTEGDNQYLITYQYIWYSVHNNGWSFLETTLELDENLIYNVIKQTIIDISAYPQ